MDYMDMLKRGWAVSWEHKYLWILGFLAALGGGNSLGGYSFNGGNADVLDFADPAAMGTLAAGIAAASCIGALIAILLWLVSLAARAGLIQSVAHHELGKPVAGFGAAFRLGWKKVWKLAAMTIVLFGVFFLIGIVLIVFLVASGGALAALSSGGEDAMGAMMAGAGILGLCALALLCLLIPLFIVETFIYAFAMRGMVLRDLGVMDSIRHGWRVLKEHLGPILMLAVAFLIFNIIAWVIAAGLLLVLGLGVAIPVGLLSNTDATFLQGLFIVLGVLGAALITALVATVVVTWQSSTFTIAYLNFTGKNIELAEA